MKSAVTICLVPQASGGPFVLHDGLAAGCARAAAFGFDAVEVFPPSADAINVDELQRCLRADGLAVAAFGTGAGWLTRELSLSANDEKVRRDAQQFVVAMIELAARFAAPVIIGSMQGRADSLAEREPALERLRQALDELGHIASSHNVTLLVEPLNRHETNLLNNLGQAKEFIESLAAANVRILADLFHMNIEEQDIAGALLNAGPHVGHVHFADSNRQAVGFGHTDVGPAIAALRRIGYAGYLSAEVLPLPSPEKAARQTLTAIRHFAS